MRDGCEARGSEGDHAGEREDCADPLLCTICGVELAPAGAHLSDDAQSEDCTLPNTCTVCGVVLDEPGEHTPRAEDCTACEHCTIAVIPGASHDFDYDLDNLVRGDDGFWRALCKNGSCEVGEIYDRGEVVDAEHVATVSLLPGGRVLLTVRVWEKYCDGTEGSFYKTFTLPRNTMRTFNVGGIPIFVDTRVENPRLWELRGITDIPVRVVVIPDGDSDDAEEDSPLPGGEWTAKTPPATLTKIQMLWYLGTKCLGAECLDTKCLYAEYLDTFSGHTHLDLTGEDIIYFLPSEELRDLLFTGFTYYDLFDAETITGTPNSLIFTDGVDFITIIEKGELMPEWEGVFND